MQKYRMGELFPQSNELLAIIAKHGWNLYDVSETPVGKEMPWDALHRKAVNDAVSFGIRND